MHSKQINSLNSLKCILYMYVMNCVCMYLCDTAIISARLSRIKNKCCERTETTVYNVCV